MLSKVFSGHSFYHACRYIVNKPGAEILESEGVRGHDYRLMADDFITQQQLRPQKEKACFHCSLSFYPGEVLSNEMMAKLAAFERIFADFKAYSLLFCGLSLVFVLGFYTLLLQLFLEVLHRFAL